MIVVHGETLWSPAPQPMDDEFSYIPDKRSTDMRKDGTEEFSAAKNPSVH